MLSVWSERSDATYGIARTASNLEYGKISGTWSFYFTGDGLNDRGWRYQKP